MLGEVTQGKPALEQLTAARQANGALMKRVHAALGELQGLSTTAQQVARSVQAQTAAAPSTTFLHMNRLAQIEAHLAAQPPMSPGTGRPARTPGRQSLRRAPSVPSHSPQAAATPEGSELSLQQRLAAAATPTQPGVTATEAVIEARFATTAAKSAAQAATSAAPPSTQPTTSELDSPPPHPLLTQSASQRASSQAADLNAAADAGEEGDAADAWAALTPAQRRLQLASHPSSMTVVGGDAPSKWAPTQEEGKAAGSSLEELAAGGLPGSPVASAAPTDASGSTGDFESYTALWQRRQQEGGSSGQGPPPAKALAPATPVTAPDADSDSDSYTDSEAGSVSVHSSTKPGSSTSTPPQTRRVPVNSPFLPTPASRPSATVPSPVSRDAPSAAMSALLSLRRGQASLLQGRLGGTTFPPAHPASSAGAQSRGGSPGTPPLAAAAPATSLSPQRAAAILSPAQHRALMDSLPSSITVSGASTPAEALFPDMQLPAQSTPSTTLAAHTSRYAQGLGRRRWGLGGGMAAMVGAANRHAKRAAQAAQDGTVTPVRGAALDTNGTGRSLPPSALAAAAAQFGGLPPTPSGASTDGPSDYTGITVKSEEGGATAWADACQPLLEGWLLLLPATPSAVAEGDTDSVTPAALAQSTEAAEAALAPAPGRATVQRLWAGLYRGPVEGGAGAEEEDVLVLHPSRHSAEQDRALNDARSGDAPRLEWPSARHVLPLSACVAMLAGPGRPLAPATGPGQTQAQQALHVDGHEGAGRVVEQLTWRLAFAPGGGAGPLHGGDVLWLPHSVLLLCASSGADWLAWLGCLSVMLGCSIADWPVPAAASQ